MPPAASAFARDFMAPTASVVPPIAEPVSERLAADAGMKPPQRRRAAPARYLGELTGPTAWSAREKRQLLRLLQARRGQPEPEAAELARDLPGRSEEEVRGVLGAERGRRRGLNGAGRRGRDQGENLPGLNELHEAGGGASWLGVGGAYLRGVARKPG